MSDSQPTLDELRGEIDAIDIAIHDLLMRRAAVAEQIGQAKSNGANTANTPEPVKPALFLRPGREAQVLRRLVARHSGPFPLAALVRLWREIMATLLRLQGPFSVAVYAGPEGSPQRGFWDLARDHFGSSTPMTACTGASQVLREVMEGRASAGVLPFPEQGETAPWWPALLGSGAAGEPRVFARLPFLADGGARVTSAALAIACVAPEATGEDLSLLVVETVEDASRARLVAALQSAGLVPLFVFDAPSKGDTLKGGGLHLIEIEGFVASADPRLAKFADAFGSALGRAAVIGAYAAPLSDQVAPSPPAFPAATVIESAPARKSAPRRAPARAKTP